MVWSCRHEKLKKRTRKLRRKLEKIEKPSGKVKYRPDCMHEILQERSPEVEQRPRGAFDKYRIRQHLPRLNQTGLSYFIILLKSHVSTTRANGFREKVELTVFALVNLENL